MYSQVMSLLINYKYETLFTNHLHHHEIWANDVKASLHRWLALVVAGAAGAGTMGMM